MQDYKVAGLPTALNPDGSQYTRPTSLDLTLTGSSRYKKGFSRNLITDKTGGGY